MEDQYEGKMDQAPYNGEPMASNTEGKASTGAAIELEHAIGFNGSIPSGLKAYVTIYQKLKTVCHVRGVLKRVAARLLPRRVDRSLVVLRAC